MYADDTEIDDACKPDDYVKLENNVNNDLQLLKEYFDINILSINITKCEFMLIGT
jgi:hypothetical protein